MKVDWNNLFKIRIANSEKSFRKHEVVKLIAMCWLLEKHRKEKNYIRIYTEWEVGTDKNKRKCDIYYENIKTKECYAIEIQKEITPRWKEEADNFYKEIQIPFMNFDWIVIPLKEFSDNINEINEKLGEYLI